MLLKGGLDKDCRSAAVVDPMLYILIFKFLDSKLEDKDSALKESKHSLTSICS